MKKAIKIFLGTLGVLAACLAVVLSIHNCKSRKSRHARAKIVVVQEEKPFVVVIPSYNNSAYCEQNIRSVLEQKYGNFRAIYIDDCSKDDTFEKVQTVVANSKQGHRFTVIKNEKNQGALANLFMAIHSCQDHEIVVTLDGDDFLAHPYVLQKLNQAYAKPEVWMTYGNYLDYPSYKQKPVYCRKIPKQIVQNNSYRSHPWCTSHLRSFYAGLFKMIKKDDLFYRDRFFPMAGDVAFMLPLLEMAGKHVQFIKEVLYLYNRTNPLNDHKLNLQLQSDCEKYVRSLPRYPRLKALPSLSGEHIDQ